MTPLEELEEKWKARDLAQDVERRLKALEGKQEERNGCVAGLFIMAVSLILAATVMYFWGAWFTTDGFQKLRVVPTSTESKK